jgi:hypothetical protein
MKGIFITIHNKYWWYFIMIFLFGVSLGILVGIILCTYLFPILDIKLEIIRHKGTNTATKLNIETQTMSYEFYRKYPEANNVQQQELSPAIGFVHNPLQDEDEEYYEDECKNKIGFKN